MRLSTSSPRACKNVSAGKPKISGSSAFHSSITAPPMTATATTANRATFKPCSNQRPLMCNSSAIHEFVVDGLQAAAQMQHGIALARKQGVQRHAGLGGQVLETLAFQLVRDEDRALVVGQFVQRRVDLVEQHL